MSISTSLLSLFSNSSTSSTSSLFSALYPNTTTASASDALTALKNAEKDQTKEIAATAAEPGVAKDIATFRSVVASATSVQQVLDNPTALKVFLSANGLGSYTSYTALAQKALMSNPASSTSLANKLSDQQWSATVKYYDFYDNGLSVLQNPTNIDSIANGYAEVTWRESLDKTTPGLSDALTFRSEASTITSATQILGDPIMRSVVTAALGLPLQIAYQPLQAQEKAITNRLDISKFQNPSFVESFVQKFLIAVAESTSSTTSTSSVLSLAVQSKTLVV